MIRKIVKLSQILIRDYFRKLDIFNKETKKINKKSNLLWLLIIIVITISFLTFKVINWLNSVGQGVLFLKIYLPIIATILLFQGTLICTDAYFFSKDLEYILSLPIKPIELLIAKFNNIISISYVMEVLFLAIPLFIYGIVVTKTIIYFFCMILVLIVIPIFFITIISLMMQIIMKLRKFIKNRDVFQILIVLIVSIVISLSEGYLLNAIFSDNIIEAQTNANNKIENVQINIEILHAKLDKLNSFFIIINPSISILTNLKMLNILLQLIKLICICSIMFFIFIIFGKMMYLKNILKNMTYINKKKNNKKIQKNLYEKSSIKKSYIKNEFKKLIKNPTFFIQCVFQYIFIVFIFLLLINLLIPIVLKSFKEQKIIDEIEKNNIILQVMCIALSIIQIISSFNNISITAISREGKNAIIMKYIPVSLYEQFIWKTIPQIVLNLIPIFGVFIILKNIANFYIWHYIVGILIAVELNIINSFTMLIVNLKNPNLSWGTENSSIKDSGNKLYQYVTTMTEVLVLIYLVKIFESINIVISLASIFIILLTILFIINFYVKKNINKLFVKIY